MGEAPCEKHRRHVTVLYPFARPVTYLKWPGSVLPEPTRPGSVLLALGGRNRPAQGPSVLLAPRPEQTCRGSVLVAPRAQPTRPGSVLLARRAEPARRGSVLLARRAEPTRPGSVLLARRAEPARRGSVLLARRAEATRPGSVLPEPTRPGSVLLARRAEPTLAIGGYLSHHLAAISMAAVYTDAVHRSPTASSASSNARWPRATPLREHPTAPTPVG